MRRRSRKSEITETQNSLVVFYWSADEVSKYKLKKTFKAKPAIHFLISSQ